MCEYTCRCRAWVGHNVIEAKLERLDRTIAEPAAPGGIVLTSESDQRVHLLTNEARFDAWRRVPGVVVAAVEGDAAAHPAGHVGGDRLPRVHEEDVHAAGE